MKQSIIVLVICTIKIFIMGNSAKKTFSNFWKQQLVNHLLFLITCFINKLTEWQWAPLGPTLVNAFLCHYEKEWLDNCPTHFKPVIYKRYVDDIFVLFSSKKHLQLFVDYMNKQHKCLKFTSEAENDNSFSFLDIKITHNNQQFKTSVYKTNFQ